jgi:CSLREA domain-containing protein
MKGETMYSNQNLAAKTTISFMVIFIILISPVMADYDADGVDLQGRYKHGYCSTAFAAGEYVYAASGTVLEILSISDLSLVGEIATESIVSSIVVSGSYAYIANWSDGFKVIDISNPADPVIVNSLAIPGQCWEVSIFGNYAYVGNDLNGLKIIDISNPLLPTIAGSFLPEPAVGFEGTQVVDNIAYAATKQGLYILDVSDPTNPIELGFSASDYGSWQVTVVDTIAYLPESNAGIRIVNISDPQNPLDLGYFGTPGPTVWIEVIGSTAYVAELTAGIQILDITNLLQPDSIGMYDTQYADGIHIQGDTLYLAASSWGLELVDISTSPELTHINGSDGGGYALDLYVRDDYAYVALRGLGLGVFEISDPVNLELLTLVDMENVFTLHGSGDYLYVVDGYNFHILDISDPAIPLITYSSSYEYINTVFCDGKILYLGGAPDLQIMDVSDPYSPELLGSLDGLLRSPNSLFVSGPFAYLANRQGGLHIINIMDPTAPESVGSYEGFEYAWSVYVSGQYAYVADRYVGLLRIIDISNPEFPFETSNYSVGDAARDISGSGSYAYVLDSWHGVRVIDCANPYNPEEVGYFDTGSYGIGIYADNGLLGVADGGGGFYLLETELKQPVFTVNSTGDASDANWGDGICDDGTGDCTLRAAIEEANAHPGYDKIAFDIEGAESHTIQPNSGLPMILEPVILDGTTEPDFLGTPIVEVDGSFAGNSNGIWINSGSCVVRGLVINRFINEAGIHLGAHGGNVIEGNYVGTNVSGSLAFGNNIGIWMLDHSKYNMIGGTSRGTGNLVSGNHETGISIVGGAYNNLVLGNLIGTDASGFGELSNNGPGIVINTQKNIIGSPVLSGSNVISGNDLSGIDIIGEAANENIIMGNFIGTDLTGSEAIPNLGSGIWIEEGSDNIIGGLEPGTGNLISGNINNGVSIFRETATGNQILGNYIGTDVFGTGTIANGTGIRLRAPNNFIGNAQPDRRNVISGNSTGIIIEWTISENNLIQGNFIGLAADGLSPLGNAFYGIKVDTYIGNNQIGGSAEGEGNSIAYNNNDGIWISHGSRIAIQSNSIYANGGLGIDLAPNGVTANDPGDVDTGPNNLQNYPERLNFGIDAADNLIFQYLVDSDSENSDYPIVVEFFLADDGGEGQMFLASDVYSSGDHDTGLKTMDLGQAINFDLEMGDYIVATATDAAGNTSEFSEMSELTDYVDVDDPIEIPDNYVLLQNYPNPFNPTTSIRYGLPETSDVSLIIYDLTGREVRRFSETAQGAGWFNLIWDGSNNNGEPVSTGVYFCRLQAGSYSQTIKMVYLR